MTLHGHNEQVASFRAAIASGRLHHAWLLAGPRGVGKATFAEAVLRWLLPTETDAKLLAAGSHPDFRRLERLPNEKTGNLARNVTVDQVRALKALFAGSTSQGARRVVIVDAIDDLERGAANALLKSLEEPPPSTIFLLISHAPGRLLPTIRSRCRTLVFRALPDDVMAAALAELSPESDPKPLIAAAGGSVGEALALAELEVGSIDAALAELAATGDPGNAVRSKLAQQLALKAATPRYEAFLRRVPGFIADQARGASGVALERALTQWSAARELAGVAQPQSLVPESVVFQLASHVAALAPPKGIAKA